MAYEIVQVNSTYPTLARECTLLEGVNQNLVSCTEGMREVASRLHRVADRVIGTRQEALGKAQAPSAPDSSLIQAFHRNGEALSEALNTLREAAQRLEAL